MYTQRGDGRGSIDVIDMDDDYNVRQWTEILDITSAQLTAVVQTVGTVASDVKRYVRTRNTPSAFNPAQDNAVVVEQTRINPLWWD